MNRDANEMQQAVSRTLRDSLGKLQRTAEELNQAVSDLVSACASTRPANALSPMLRAQTSAASLAASLEVLSRFVTGALQPAASVIPDLAPAPAPVVENAAENVAATVAETPAPAPPAPPAVEAAETVVPLPASDVVEEDSGSLNAPIPVGMADFQGNPQEAVAEQFQPDQFDKERFQEAVQAEVQAEAFQSFEPQTPPVETTANEALPAVAAGFDLSTLPMEEQELHRRANRVAKVSMQDIKMLLGRKP